jgi:hypothetical protein
MHNNTSFWEKTYQSQLYKSSYFPHTAYSKHQNKAKLLSVIKLSGKKFFTEQSNFRIINFYVLANNNFDGLVNVL